MNRKGFTLIELLATIVIMALILLMVMPSITALQENNKEKPFEYYGSSLIEAAKLYVDKEGEDITSLGLSNWSGCVDISYEDLINSKLIQPYEDKEYNCSINTKVRYTKDRSGNDSYEYNMTCEDNKGKVAFEHIGIEDKSACKVIDMSDITPPTCGEAIGASTEWTKENRTITLTCSDENGCESVTKTFDKSTKVGYITIEDGKGNKRNCPVNVYIDKTPPKCVSSGGSDNWTKENITLTGTCTDDESGCKGNITKPYVYEANLTEQSPGIVTDMVGNETICPSDQTVKIDKTPPTYEARYLSNFYLPNSDSVHDRVIQIRLNDPLSGIKKAIYTIPFSANETYEITYDNDDNTSPIENFALSNTTDALFSIVITDNAENSLTINANYYNLETTPLTTYR